MSADLTLKLLKAISNPVRKSMIQSLSQETMGFSEIMRACGLNPNYDTGPFVYHLSSLTDLNIIKRSDGGYGLTEFGIKIAEFISAVEREGSFLLKSPQKLGGEEATMEEIEAKWLKINDVWSGEYGILLMPPETPKEERRKGEFPPEGPELKEIWNWVDSLPSVKRVPDKFHVLGFEKNGKKLGCMKIRISTGFPRSKYAQSIEDARKVRGLAFIEAMWVLGKACKEVGETRVSVASEMMVEFEKIVKEHNIETIVFEDLLADDEEIVDVLKELGYERVFTRYYMRKTGIA